MKKSSHSTPDPKLAYRKIAVEKLLPPQGLFDVRVPVSEDAAAQFLPVFVYGKNGKFVIIDGCKRHLILKTRGEKTISCFLIRKTVSPEKAGLLRIKLNANRQLHPREKLLFISWLTSHFNQKEYRKHIETLCLPAGERHEYEQLAACKPWLIEAVMRGTLDAAVAPEMNHLPEPDAGALIKLFSVLSFSRQMQRELAEWLPEIAFFRKTSLPVLLGSSPFTDLCADTRLNNPQKIAKIHDEAHSLRFPLFSETRKKWTERAGRINPEPSKVSFQASPYFEKSSLEIRIKAENAEETQRIMQNLASIDLYTWHELIDPASLITPPLSDNRTDGKNKLIM